MTEAGSVHFVAAGIHALPALVWGIVALDAWRFLLVRRPASRFFLLLTGVSSLWTLHYLLHAFVELTPTELDGRLPGLHAAFEIAVGLSVVWSMAMLRHMVPLLPVREEPPAARWLALNYGAAAAVSAIVVAPFVASWPASGPAELSANVVEVAYCLGAAVLGLRDLRRLARRGAWRPGVLELSSPDVVIVTAVTLGSFGLLVVWLAGGGSTPLTSVWQLAFHTLVGLGLAVPFVVRMLGELLRRLLLLAALAAAVAVGAPLYRLGAGLAGAEARRLVDLGALVVLVLAAGPGQAWLRSAIDRLVFRRSRHRRAELQAFLHTLSPELGVVECARRALGALTGVMGIPGAGVLLASGDAAAHGAFDPAPLGAHWPRDPAADPVPPGAAFALSRELPLPLREAAVEAGVAWVAPIRSPRRHWGHLFATEGYIAGRFGEAADLEALAAFVGQLALVLDGAELLARAVAVERSLAHAEKLAAIGELAARIAHDIRNPVTAARSLAQQLAREPASPFTAEHGVILEELERVERRVAALLRFARREEFRFEAVDLGDLVRATVEAFRPRLEVGGVGVGMDLAEGVIASADPEKLRQALVNLVENALDALAGGPSPRRLTVAVTARNGSATIRVADSGPGVPADTLPRLFEPFFSLKPTGTGLGLAIAKRTVDAHGGRIAATSSPGAGLTVEIALPLPERP